MEVFQVLGLLLVLFLFVLGWRDTVRAAKEKRLRQQQRAQEANRREQARQQKLIARIDNVISDIVDIQNKAMQRAEGPPAVYGRLVITYDGESGTIDRHTVRVISVHPRKRELIGWSEQLAARRAFMFPRIQELADADTGEILIFPEWLKQCAEIRKRNRTPPA